MSRDARAAHRRLNAVRAFPIGFATVIRGGQRLSSPCTCSSQKPKARKSKQHDQSEKPQPTVDSWMRAWQDTLPYVERHLGLSA